MCSFPRAPWWTQLGRDSYPGKEKALIMNSGAVYFRRSKKVLHLHCSDFRWVYSFPSYPILCPPSTSTQRQPIVSLSCVLFQKYFMCRHTECINVHVIFAMFSPTEAYYTMVDNGAESLKAAILKLGFLISNPGSTI